MRVQWPQTAFVREGLRPEFSEKTLLKRGNEPPRIYEYYEHYEYYESGIFNRCTVPAGGVSQHYVRRTATGPRVILSARGACLAFRVVLDCASSPTANLPLRTAAPGKRSDRCRVESKPTFGRRSADVRSGNLHPAPNTAGSVFIAFIVFIVSPAPICGQCRGRRSARPIATKKDRRKSFAAVSDFDRLQR